LIKAIKDKYCVRILTDDLSDAKKIVDELNQIFVIQENDNENRLSEGHIKQELLDREELDYSLVKEDLFSLNNLQQEYPEIKSIEASYGHYENRSSITNSNADLVEENYFNYYSVGITMQKEDVTKIVYADYYTKNYDFETFKQYIVKKVDILAIKLNSTSCKTDKYKVILQNNVVANILEQFCGMFHSRNMYLKESVLVDKFGTKVFSDKVTIIEDPSSENAIVPSYFDSEGTPTTYKELVKDGVYVKQINNIEYALKTNEEPTGNASGVNHMYLVPGKKNYSDLLNELHDGIIIDEAHGLHSGVDVKSGNISVQAEGVLVENGKIVRGLNMIVLSTNIFEILNNILEIGNDMSCSLDVLAPSILLENITIAGDINE
ncbi:MAG: TldD/PmbA family protein, partial [Bacilli bacterium]|nr:TldD/PmbA family protein [Bacilli bacterium]